jgi:peroxiredoxin
MPTFDGVMRYIYIVLTLLFVALCGTNCSVIMDDMPESDYEKTTLVRVGDVAPDFTVELLSGESVTLSQLQGQTVLLVFFSSTCPDCLSQLNLLGGLSDILDSEKFSLLTISRGEERKDVSTFVEQNNYSFAVGLDTDKSIYSLYATKYVPRCFVVDPLGRIVALSTDFDEDEFALLVEVIKNLQR